MDSGCSLILFAFVMSRVPFSTTGYGGPSLWCLNVVLAPRPDIRARQIAEVVQNFGTLARNRVNQRHVQKGWFSAEIVAEACPSFR